MSFEVPADLYYVASHEWVAPEDDTARVGITDFAQDELGEVVFVDLPEAGDTIAAEAPFGVVESIKAVSDLYAPIAGEVVAVNDRLFDEPELVNEDPYGEGWMIVIEPDDPEPYEALLDAEEYRDQIA